MPTLQNVTRRKLEPPLRGEPFSAEHLWNYAEQFATSQVVARGGADRRLVDRFESNSRFIADAYRAISQSIRDGEPLAPDAEWLVDNYYVVEEQLREIREDLPRSYYLELPKLASGPFAGFPRVYELAHELAVHSDSSLDEELISGFIAGYQRVVPLTSGELWAVPIMLRLVLVENLRRLCAHMLAARQCRDEANQILGRWTSGDDTFSIGDIDDGYSMLVTELIECLRDSSANGGVLAPHELAERLGQPQEILDECVRREQQRLAANQVSIGNAITSMRLISALDWSLFFERVSLVEQILRRDPLGVYAKMDFATRDQYRHEIERIAKRGEHGETQIASAALERALLASGKADTDTRQHHVGYYLIDEGRFELERAFHYRLKFKERAVRFVLRHAASIYLTGIALVTALGTASFVAAIRAAGVSLTAAIVLGGLSILPASELAVGLVNFLVTLCIRPRLLPKMDFAEEIPSHCHTLVVMPAMLANLSEVDRLLERLEVHYLANLEPGLSFALLTDYVDAPEEESTDDNKLLAAAMAGVAALNKRYADEGQRRFFLLHRRRKWNPVEKLWIGWERKRGKIIELNRLLRGATDTTFVNDPNDQAALSTVKLVITLDSDTRLPHAAARRLAGTLAHPLNRPHFDETLHRVTRGYGLLQPRVSVSLASANRTLFSRLFSNSGGLDPYSTAVSDVYQDMFGEASYTGKGIYDVDAFAAATRDAFPPNHILSHDLIEGCHARVGAVTDVELFDEYPTRVDVDSRRQHRWTRGDWQLLPWLFPSVPALHGRRRNPLTAVSRWKVFDNLRRSLVPASLITLCLVGWYALPFIAWLTTLSIITVLASPFFFHVLSALVLWRPGQYWRQEWRDMAATFGRTLLQCALALIFLPFRAYNLVDAIVRTLYRLTISRQKLLEWETSEAAERKFNRNSTSAPRVMYLIAAGCLAATLALPSDVRWGAISLLGLWFTSPWIANYLSRPYLRAPAPLSATDRLALRRIARRTWAFFEQFVGPEDNWLPPDNFQEFPRPKTAHRISPTNEGLYVLSAIAARDFGYIGMSDLVELLERNLDRWTNLERYFGHFYNWYNTTTLEPLAPRYVSTADSGNLAASFLTAQQGLIDIVGAPLFGPFVNDGLSDSVRICDEALARLQPRGARFVSPALTDLEAELAQVREVATNVPADLTEWWQLVARLKAHADRFPRLLHDFETSLGLKAAEFAAKVMSLKSELDGLKVDADSFMPWLKYLSSTDNAGSAAISNGHPTTSAPASAVAKHPAWQGVLAELRATHSLNDVATLADRSAHHVATLASSLDTIGISPHEIDGIKTWLESIQSAISKSSDRAIDVHDRYLRLGRRYEALAKEMDFTLLYNPQRRLFSVGLNLEDGRLDRAHYDMLASEARIASLVAIAKGDAEHRHWFQLGRALTEALPGRVGLLSWAGTMFEYLMPHLFSPNVPGSLLERSCDAAVERQIAYGRQRRVPWGISESAFAAQAANGDYHYQSFGVPGLGLKRGLGKDLVISPYSTALALPIRPAAAAANFRYLAAQGAEGPWGFYDAVDYTPERVPEGERRVVVFSYMAHHQGMIMTALANFLRDRSLQRRFQRQPLVRSTDLLLQERIPVAVLHFNPQDDAAVAVPSLPVVLGPVSRQISTPHTVVPRAHLLSNGQYSVMVTNTGGGYSRCNDIAITRWRADTTRDHWGQFVYVRDTATQKVWSAHYHPTQVEPDNYEVTYSIDKAEFRRRDGNLETHLEVTISRESNAEVRQVTIYNHGRKPATLDLTSYAEIVLCPAAADAAHPAFNKLFVETEYLGDCPALIARRRPREAGADVPWAVHVLAAQPSGLETLQFETDRARFLGRARTAANPAALDPGAALSGTTGPVLDAIFSLRGRLRVAPDESASLAFVTAYATSREEALQLADRYRDPRVVQRTFEMAWAHSQVEMRHMHVSPASVQMFQRLASALLYPDASLRAPLPVLKANRRGQRSLWRYGISGDVPIVLVRITRPEHRTLVRELLLAHEFCHTHGLKADLIIVNEHPAGYFDGFQEQLLELIHTTTRVPLDKPGGVYLLRAAQLAPEDLVLLQEVAAVSLHGDRGSLAQQVEAPRVPPAEPLKLRPLRPGVDAEAARDTIERSPALEFANRFGGFDNTGDYIVRLAENQVAPAPWSNIVANSQFGCLVTESGGGYTWAGNSRENKLTAWSNDPVCDSPSEILYIRDEESGAYWTATPLPIRGKTEYTIRHGRGFTSFTHTVNGIRSELLVSIAPDDCLKFICLKLHNETNRLRSLSATCYAEWVLGVSRDSTHMHVYTERDAASGAILAHNSYHEEFPDQAAILHVLGRADSMSGDRTEFIGRNGDFQNPAAMARIELSGRTGAGLDPCGAVQKKFRVKPGDEAEVIFLLGWTDGEKSVADLLAAFQTPSQVHRAIEQTLEFWRNTLTTIEVKTPNRAFDLLVNHWLLYQTLSCRVWGRSAFYQSGGAFGFRDQLQDVAALVYSRPDIAREVIVQAASRQFELGDVQHWWHPPSGRGVRTRFSDDHLWLPFVVSHYVSVTDDTEILKQRIPYLQSLPLEPHEEERYELPEVSSVVEDLYAHCVRAIDHGFRFGDHDLPLMGCGDWNDGMNKVGADGKGESVWLAWFLRVVLQRFIPFVEERGDSQRAALYRAEAERLLQAVEEHAWDGKWYRRAYFGDGTPLGSQQNDECQIDSLAQSWSVIAEGDPSRSRIAMRAAEERLVKPDDRLVQLLDPPFDNSKLEPGYIKGYPPGIRENGGQYTHAALWFVQALTLEGKGTKAMEVFSLLNPIQNASTDRVENYRVEPYVVAADVYSMAPHVGRGGWTWYTGSSGWMYRMAIECILGLRLHGNRLTLAPCISSKWRGCDIRIRRGASTWTVRILNPEGVEYGIKEVRLDNRQIDRCDVNLHDDLSDHSIEVTLGTPILCGEIDGEASTTVDKEKPPGFSKEVYEGTF
jgi:cyclic beta-1,2-glucan synthetase